MIPELGHYALILSLCMAIVLSVVPLVGSLSNTPAWMNMARPVAWGQFVFLSLALAALTHAFLVDDFSVLYVAQHGNTHLKAGQHQQRSGCPVGPPSKKGTAQGKSGEKCADGGGYRIDIHPNDQAELLHP